MSKEKSRGTLTDEITNITGIFRAHKECQKPRTVLIEGDHGMGKTTFCQKLAYDWATKQQEWDESFPEIEVLLLLRCHDIKSDIWEAIDDQILPKDVDEEVRSSFFKFIRGNQSKVLLVFDGLDEADSSIPEMYFNLVKGKVLPGCHIVLTSRHEAGRKLRRYCDTLWDIAGFTKSDAESFILKYFKNMEHSPEKLLEELRSDWPEHREIIELTTNPLNTALLCILCEDYKGVLPNNKTQLYIEIVRCVLRRYETKHGLPSKEDDPIIVYKEELIQLGRMALQSLRKGQFFIEEQELGCSSNVLTKFGFLSIQTGGPKRKPSLRYGFSHKSFQEFFAGFHLASLIINEEIDCDSVVTDESFKSELKQVFLFMSGIVALQCETTSVSLVKSLTAHINLLDGSFVINEGIEFAFDYIDACITDENNLLYQLIDVLGRNLDVRTLEVKWNKYIYFYLACEVLKVNTSLTYLDLSGNEIDDSGASFLSEALNINTCLTDLEFRGNEIGPSGARSFSEALKINKCLTHLGLSHNQVGDSGASSLSEALKVNTCRLTYLDLGANKVGDLGASYLCEALKVNKCLTCLELYGNEIGASGAASFSEALMVNTCLTHLDLNFNKVGYSGASSLSEALKVNKCLTRLHLDGNKVGDVGASSLSEALKVNKCLTRLHLNRNKVGDFGASSLSEALKHNTCLTYLDLNDNEIGTSGAAAISKALKVNTCLTNLDLDDNEIGDSGAISFAEALKVNTCLTDLNLSRNTIGATGATSLSEALKVNTCLTDLNLSWNRIGASGATSLSEALKVNKCLTALNLRGNMVGDSGASSLSEALKVNTYLTNLNLGVNKVRESGASSLSEALKLNTCLTCLHLDANKVGDSGASSLSEALKINRGLTNLYLGVNKVGGSGSLSRFEAFRVNMGLASLDMKRKKISASGASSVAETIKVDWLTSLHLSSNKISASGAAALSEACRVNKRVKVD